MKSWKARAGSSCTKTSVEAKSTSARGYTEDGFADKVYHLHLKRLGDWDELVFRDYLEGHPKVAADYAALKLDLLSKFKYNRPAYTEAKTDFIRNVVKRARNDE
ncbi:hypothetical protein BINDI_0322 [Bifidobacterium [indicum] DSM 20214 = LMG 11587]|uniref:GrpB family protein n=1 Tax=Bifidobacterium [indicum] DSM 20214 = LMG 11587 TaxID=1341694 RepID=A0A087VTE0_9BIFI|nr:hypothetical protein BINDI_0322 [Bifidobacterium indicum LMG 11587 = DSM 20214]